MPAARQGRSNRDSHRNPEMPPKLHSQLNGGRAGRLSGASVSCFHRFTPFFTTKLTFSRHFWHMTYYSSQLEHTFFTRNTRQPVSNPLLQQHRPGRLPLSPPYYIEEAPHTLEQPTPPLQYDRRQGQHSGRPRQPVPPPPPGSPGLRLPVLEPSPPYQEPALPDRSPPTPESPARPSPLPLSRP